MSYKQQIFILHSSGAWSLRWGCQHGHMTSLFLAGLLFVSSEEGGQGSSVWSLSLGNNSNNAIMRVLPSWPKNHPKVLLNTITFSSVELLSHVWLFATLWTAACQASLSITSSQSLLKPMSIESVMPSNHLILCHPLPPTSIFPSIKVFFKWSSSSHQVAKVLELHL